MDDRTRAGLRALAGAIGGLARATYRSDLIELLARSVGEALGAPCLVAGGIDDHIDLATHGDFDPKLRELLAPGRDLAASLLGTFAADGVKVLRGDELVVRYPGQVHQPSALLFAPLRDHELLVGALVVVRTSGELDAFDREIVDLLVAQAGPQLRSLPNRTAEAEDHERHAPRFLDAIIENIPDMVFVKEAGRLSFVRFNKAGEELLGIPRTDLIGKNDFDFFPRDEAEFFVSKDRETLNNKTLIDIPEEPIQTAHGQRWLHTKKVPIVDANGTPRYLLGISSDITATKRTLRELRDAKDAAEAANRELESFSYSVAHDLRAPLRAIDGFSQALLEDFGSRLNEVGHNYLTRVRTNAQRMAGLIDDLLELSRVTRWELKRQPVDIAEIARESLGSLQRAEPNRAVEIVISGDTHAAGDPKLLAIVFDNLCGNAWKFTSKRTHAKIEIGGTYGTFHVRDNGVGFDPKYSSKLFGVFQRLHAESDFPGTGIGLATVQRIVQRHGGRVWADGKVGEGATFYFTLGEP